MRGGSQSFTVLGNDGHHYVAKFQHNPQGNRTLVNEWIGGHLLQRLGVVTPKLRILRLSDHVVGDDFFFSTPDGPQRIAAGLHLGSLYPVNPDRVAIYDFLPDKIIEAHLVNRRDFLTTFIFDCWAGHADQRQVIFVRNPRRKGFEANFIDHGWCFGAHSWKLIADPIVCRSFHRAAYRALDMQSIANETIEVIRSWTLADIEELVSSIPREWFDVDKDAFGRMASQLIARTDSILAEIPEGMALLRRYSYSYAKTAANGC